MNGRRSIASMGADALYWLTGRLAAGRRSPPPSPRSLLFLQYERPLGTAALATATFATAKARIPGVRITVAASGVSANVLRASPHVDEVIVTPPVGGQWWRALAYFITRIRPRRRTFDYVISDTSQQLARVGLLTVASGVAWRAGLSARPGLYHLSLAEDETLSLIANNLQLLDAIGAPGPSLGPEIHFTRADLEKAREVLAAIPAGETPLIAMVTQASKGHPNEWFDDRWIALSRRLTERLGARLVFVGTQADRVDIDRIRAAVGAPTLSAAGRTDVPQLAALLAQCDLTVTIDTGGLHVARAVGAPAVVIGHSATPKQTWLPLDEPLYRILLHDYVPCAYCRKFTCATRECMQESTVEMVEDAVLEHLKAFQPSAEARAARVAARLAD
jgi:ADP-heptose:LPS heptosyltransferase